VCVSVRLYVSTVLNGSSPNLEGTFYGSWHVLWAIYFLCVQSLIFERIISKFAGNILLLTISVNNMYYSFARTARTRASAHVRERAWLSIRLSMDRRFSNLRWTYYKSQQVAWAMYFSFSRTARTRASARMRERAWLSIRLFMDRRFSNLRWTYYKSHQVAWATYCSCSLTARTRASARVRAHVVKTFTHIWTDSLQICWAHTTDDHTLHGLHTYHVHAPRAHARARLCERARD
jgi:hypothetical protein